MDVRGLHFRCMLIQNADAVSYGGVLSNKTMRVAGDKEI